MEISKMRTALQNIVVRLEHAEKRYTALKKHLPNPAEKRIFSNMAKERRKFKRSINYCLKSLGTGHHDTSKTMTDLNPTNTSSRGAANRINDILAEARKNTDEILNDYTRIINSISLPPRLAQLLISQKNRIEQARISRFDKYSKPDRMAV